MRRVTLLFVCALLLAGACSRRYLNEGQVSSGFDTRRSYKVAIMPFMVRGLRTPGMFERDMAYDVLSRRLMSTGKLLPMDGFTVRDAVKKHEFGQQGFVDPVKARSIGKELGADLVSLAELSFEQVEPAPILVATVKLYSVDSPTILYSGLGRSTNPLSLNAAAEFALDLATSKLARSMR